MTIGGELNRLASNVAIGSNIAGVHWRSDGTESLYLPTGADAQADDSRLREDDLGDDTRPRSNLRS